MRTTPFSRTGAARAVFLAALAGAAGVAGATDAPALPATGIQFNLRPRVCTLSSRDRQCETQVHAEWSAPRAESLCLLIVGRPEIRHCWERERSGTYTLDLVFAQDLTLELREADLQHILASETLRVIREAVDYRHRHRQPWSIFD